MSRRLAQFFTAAVMASSIAFSVAAKDGRPVTYDSVDSTLRGNEARVNRNFSSATGVSHRPKSSGRSSYRVKLKAANRALDTASAALEEERYADACKALREAEGILTEGGYDQLLKQISDVTEEACARS